MMGFFKWLFGTGYAVNPKSTIEPATSEMNEGDIHSGPHGYSPNTPYQETQYGSRFDEEAEWNEEH